MDTPSNSIFSSPVTSIFNAMHFEENPVTCQRKKRKRQKGLRVSISHFYGSFSNDIMAVILKLQRHTEKTSSSPVLNGLCGLVKHDHLGFSDEGTGQTQQLPLTQTEQAHIHTHIHRQSTADACHAVSQPDLVQRSPQLLIRQCAAGVKVGAKRAGKQRGVLNERMGQYEG